MREVLSLPTRAGALGGLRAVMLAAVVTATWLAPAAAGERTDVVLSICGAYALLALALEGLRLAGRLPRTVLGGSLLVDGVFLVAVITLTGGPEGVLGLLLLVYLIAVTLLLSYRTGLKLVVWNSLLLAVAHWAHRADLVGGAGPSRSAAVTAATALVVVAVVTAGCSALNERELRRGRAGYGALAALAADMQRVERLEDIGPRLLEAVERHTGARATVLLRHEDDGEFLCWATGGEQRTVALLPTEATGVVGRCWTSGEAVLVRALDRRADHALADVLPGARNLVVLPLLGDGGPLGALVVERGGSRWARVPASVVAILGQFARHTALAYQNVDLRQQLERLAALDGLTRLPNRRMFDEALRRESGRARRAGESLAVLLLDIDHFKAVNDRHGHLVGDEVLRQVAEVVAGHVRGSDLAARYGGEEFAVLLPACDTAGAVGVAEKLRDAVAGGTVPIPVTVSIGAASLPRDAPDGLELVAAADAALYRAKAAGRNVVVRATGWADGAEGATATWMPLTGGSVTPRNDAVRPS